MISLTIPVLREKELLKRAIPLIINEISRITSDYEIIITSDGNECIETIEYLKKEHNKIVSCHSEIRRGKGGAISDALDIANGDIFCFVDVDLSTDLKHITDAINILNSNKYDIVIGTRMKNDSSVKRSIIREMASHAYINYVKINLEVPSISDFQCGFKAFKTSVLRQISTNTEERGWAWDTEIIVRAIRAGYKIYEMPVIWTESESSNMKLKDVLKMAISVKNIKKRLNCQ